MFWCRNTDSELWDLQNNNYTYPLAPTTDGWREANIDIYSRLESPIEVGAAPSTGPTSPSMRTSSKTDFRTQLPGRCQSHPTAGTLPVLVIWSRGGGEECMRMALRKRCTYGALHETTSGSWSTGKEVPKPGIGWWDRIWKEERTADTTNCFTHNTTVLVDRKTGQVNVPGGIRARNCHFQDHFCPLIDNEMIIWTQHAEETCQFRRLKANWTGEADGNLRMWISKSKDFALSFRDTKMPENIKDCGQNLVISDQSLAIPAAQFSAMWGRRNRRELDTEAEVGGEATASNFAALRALNQTVQTLKHAECERRAKELKELPTLYLNNPTGAARVLLRRQAVQARWATTGILEIWNCVPIAIEQLRFRPSGATCYIFLPVNTTILGRPFDGFLDTNTGILTATSPIGPCEVYARQFLRSKRDLLAIDQRTATYPKNIHEPKKWTPHHDSVDFPELEPIIFHSALHTPTDDLIPSEHLEEQLREQSMSSAETKTTEGNTADRGRGFDIIGKAEEAFLSQLETIRQWALNICLVYVMGQLLFASLAFAKLRSGSKWRSGGLWPESRGTWRGQ